MGSATGAVPPEVVAAVERLVRHGEASLARIAAAAGLPQTTVTGWMRDRGWARTRPVRPRGTDDILADLAALERCGDPVRVPADLPVLRRRLRAHIGRQIATFDAALRGEGAAVIDSARTLRDLGGLKRLLDDLAADDPASEGEGDGDGRTPSALDLPGLRAEIARRYGGCRGDRPDGRLSGEPAAAAPPGAGA